MLDIVSQLGLGTAQFGSAYGIASDGKGVSDEAMMNMLTKAREAGVTTLDTAQAYGNAEERLGQHDLKGFDIVTKINIPTGTLSNFDSERLISESLSRLGVEQIDAVLVHNTESAPTDRLAEALGMMAVLIEKGLCRRIGVSMYNPGRLEIAAKAYPISIVQLPFNVFDQRLVQGNILEQCRQLGIEVHVRSIFLQALLVTEPANIPPYFQPWADNLRAYWDWTRRPKLVPYVQAALNFVSSHINSGIHRLIVGADSPRQLGEIIASASETNPLPAPELSCDDINLINPSLWPQP